MQGGISGSLRLGARVLGGDLRGFVRGLRLSCGGVGRLCVLVGRIVMGQSWNRPFGGRKRGIG